MGKIFSLFVLLVLSFLTVSAQNSIQQAFFEVRAKVEDKENIPLAGMSLFIEGDKFKQTVVSDENGQFSIKFPVGKFTIKGNEATSKNFLTFLEIFADKPNPTDFDLIVETNQICCSPTSDGRPTEIINVATPSYPPARATRTQGEVIVFVEINKDGIVSLAKAEVGHPLLKAACEVAAKNLRFTKDENSKERKGKIIYVFVINSKQKVGSVFRKPNRIEIFPISSLDF